MTRLQCAKCPWKVRTNAHAIPDGYSVEKHQDLEKTIATHAQLDFFNGKLNIMACHESRPGHETPCVGWLVNQLGPGNNIALRIAVMDKRINADVETVGEQCKNFRETLP